MKYRAGDLRTRVDVQQRIDIQNSLGESLPTYEVICSRWAQVKPLTSTEQTRAKQAQLETTHNVVMRYFSDITTADRLQYTEANGTTHTLNITGKVNVENRNTWLELPCVEVTSG